MYLYKPFSIRNYKQRASAEKILFAHNLVANDFSCKGSLIEIKLTFTVCAGTLNCCAVGYVSCSRSVCMVLGCPRQSSAALGSWPVWTGFMSFLWLSHSEPKFACLKCFRNWFDLLVRSIFGFRESLIRARMLCTGWNNVDKHSWECRGF